MHCGASGILSSHTASSYGHCCHAAALSRNSSRLVWSRGLVVCQRLEPFSPVTRFPISGSINSVGICCLSACRWPHHYVGHWRKTGSKPLSTSGQNSLALLLSSVSIVWKRPKVGLGGIVATIVTTSEFAANVVFNLLWGCIADRIGWHITITSRDVDHESGLGNEHMDRPVQQSFLNVFQQGKTRCLPVTAKTGRS